jgi:hypothetical protein
MPSSVPRATKPPKIERKAVRAWQKGTITSLDDGRTPEDGLRSSSNVMLDQDGTIRPRGSLMTYGPQPASGWSILGEVYEFTRIESGLRVSYMVCIMTDGNDAYVYYAKGEDTSWTEALGPSSTHVNFSTTHAAHFKQVADKLLILNGSDPLTFLDTTNFELTRYTSLTNPASAPSGTASSGLSGTSFKVYYAYTANSTVGETLPSPVLTKAVGKDRDIWDSSADYIDVTWSAVSNAQSYNLYMGISADGAGQPKLYAIATGIDSSTLSLRDNGTLAQDPNRPAPTFNSTAGPKATRAEVVNGRPFLVGDTDNPYYVWRGGDYGYELDFSPSNGGGYTPVGQGTKEIPNSVKSYRDGQGNQRVMVLAGGTNGNGKRYFLSPQSVTYGSTSFIAWQVTEDYGQDGTDSPDGVVIYQNDAHYPSRDGFKTTGTRPQLQNVLSTNRTSNTIQTDISAINTAVASKIVGLAFEGKIYWALPVGEDRNNQVWVLDLDRGGAWMKPLYIECDWMWLYSDNSGRTHFLMLVNNSICEMSYAVKTTDNGVKFPTSFNSGQNGFSEDTREWARLIQLVFRIQRPRGLINFTASVKTEDGILSFTESEDFGANSSRVGIDEPLEIDSPLRAIDGIYGVPIDSSVAMAEFPLEIDEEAQWYQYGAFSNTSGVDYNFSDVIAEYVPVGIKDLS